MADYYTNLSFIVDLPSAEAADGAVALLAEIEEYIESPEGKAGFERFSDYVGEWYSAGVAVSTEGESVWVRDDCGTPQLDLLCDWLQEVLARFDEDGVIAFEWANDCSKARVGAFGGGCVVLTKDNQDWMNTSMWMEARVTEFKEARAHGKNESNGTLKYRCETCEGDKIEMCLPGFYEANKDFPLVSTDMEASALSYYCRSCEKSVAVKTPDDTIDVGRWGKD